MEVAAVEVAVPSARWAAESQELLLFSTAVSAQAPPPGGIRLEKGTARLPNSGNAKLGSNKKPAKALNTNAKPQSLGSKEAL